MRLEDTIVSANYATLMLRLCEKKGIPMPLVLKGTDIDPEIFTLSSAFITGKQFVQLCQNALEHYDDPAFGIHYGLELSISTHGMVGFAAMTSQNLREGLAMMMLYYKSIFSLITLNLNETDGMVVFDFDIPFDVGVLQDKMIDGFLIGFGSVANFLLGDRIPPVRIRLRSSYNSSYDAIPEFFDADVEFECDKNELIFDANLLNISLPAADPQTVLIAREHCDHLMKQIEVTETFPDQVRKTLFASKDRLPNLEALAEHFNMHPRTLGRHLNKYNSSYQVLLDEVREVLALEYLANPKMLVEDIAYALNFNDTSSFYRAFKRWTGETPSSQRKKLMQQNAPRSQLFSSARVGIV